jgi:SAM-dependent methyltransferase
MLRPKQKKLDIGATDLPRECTDEDEGWIGVDLNVEAICPYCGDKKHNIVEMNAEALDFPDEYFDEVFSGDCVAKYTNDRGLSEMFRVLAPHGKWAIRCDLPWVAHALEWITSRGLRVSKIEPVNGGEDTGWNDLWIEGTKDTNDWITTHNDELHLLKREYRVNED